MTGCLAKLGVCLRACLDRWSRAEQGLGARRSVQAVGGACEEAQELNHGQSG